MRSAWRSSSTLSSPGSSKRSCVRRSRATSARPRDVRLAAADARPGVPGAEREQDHLRELERAAPGPARDLLAAKPLRTALDRLFGLELRRLAGPPVPGWRTPRRWLELYAARFDTVEVNATFYRLPSATRGGWVSQTPAGFTFAVKASRYLTHVKRLTDRRPASSGSMNLEPLRGAGRFGPVLWQLPENFHRDDASLADWRSVAGRAAHVRVSPSELVREAGLDQLRHHGVALTIGDHPKRPFQPTRRPRWRYVRFHYGAREARELLRRELDQWAERIAPGGAR